MVGSDALSARHPLVVAGTSDAGREALRAGLECAQESGGRLSVVYLLQTLPRWWMGAGPVCCTMPAPRDLSNFEVAETTLAAARIAVPSHIPLKTQLLAGSQNHCEQVLGAACAFGCDMIVVAAPRSFIGLRLGFVFTLIRRSEIPVALIHAKPIQSASVGGTCVADDPMLLGEAREISNSEAAGTLAAVC